MIDSETAIKTRAKPRNRKPAAYDDVDDLEDPSGVKKAKRRRANQKRADDQDDDERRQPFREMQQLPLGPDSLHRVQHLHEGQRYDRQPRLLPEIDGVESLSLHEAQLDIKSIQQQLTAFEAKAGVNLPGGRPAVGDKDHRRLFLVDENDSDADAATLKNRRTRPSGVIAPEEIVETLPAARRAVRITQRELRAMRIEREDLERAYVRHRCTLLWQVGEMKRMQKQHERVTRALSRDVVNTARELESSRRRTNALQDIMNELEARGSSILRLTRQKSRLEAMLEAKGAELPEIDEEENVEVLPSDTTYVETEEALKQRFFEKIGALVKPTGKLRMLNGAFDFTRGNSDSEEDYDDSDGSSSSDDESSATPADDSLEETSQRRGKKRRLVMTPRLGRTPKVQEPPCD
ncbi:2-isopropylmalate synthase [Phytophthora cinnamomi]|uniref:2-isopropylmalate synthase n=1 Tax=Phytophthora cinnamomi TaxID=4785 RepID=UPI00355AACAC|nr:2-isopropylmalate synthase [Phytophthora cinnamomi]